MNDNRLKKLFNAARAETPPAAPDDFAAGVLRAVRQEAPPGRESLSLFDQLNRLFPKIAVVAVALIGVCVAGEILTSTNSPDLSDGIAEVSDQWLFPVKGF